MIRPRVPSSGSMHRPLRILLLGVAVVAVGAMAAGYAFIFRDIATPPGGALGTVEVPGPDATVATALLDDGTPVFVVRDDGTVRVLDARAPVTAGTVPPLVAWCAEISAFVAGGTTGFEGDGTGFGPDATAGLTRYGIGDEADGRVTVLGSTSRAQARDDAAPDCPPDTELVAHRPADGEVFDPSVAVDAEPPGVVWLEGTLRAIGNQALLCDATAANADGSCATGAVVRDVDPATIGPEGARGLFIGVVRDRGIVSLAHAAALASAEAS